MATRSIEERIKELEDKEQRAKQQIKRLQAQKKQESRKKRNARIYAVGAHAESVIGAPPESISIEDYKQCVGRLIRIGVAAEEVYGREVDPTIFKFFLLNQEERGRYYSRFLEQREAARPESQTEHS